MLVEILCQRAALLINKTLDEDPKHRDELSSLGDCTIVFQLSLEESLPEPATHLLTLISSILPGAPELSNTSDAVFKAIPSTIWLNIKQSEITFHTASDDAAIQQADIRVHGTPLAIGQLIWRDLNGTKTSSENPPSIPPDKLNIEGDYSRLRDILITLRQLDIDWESTLADYLGDVPAHLFEQAFEGTKDWSRDSMQRFQESCSNYRNEERNAKGARPQDPMEAFDLLANRLGSLLSPNLQQRKH